MGIAQRHSEVTPFAPVTELHPVSDHPQAGESAGGSLVSSLGALQAIEDDIVGVLVEAQAILESLETHHVHDDAGFRSFAEMESRLVHPSSMLHAMRLAVPRALFERSKGRRKRGAAGGRPEGGDRARRLSGLAALSQSLVSLRSMDDRLHNLADSARFALDDVEASQLYEECGYASVEEFIERALAPSPVLASIFALIADQEPPAAAQAPGEAFARMSGSHAIPGVPSSESLVDLNDVSLLEAQAGNDLLSGGADTPGESAETPAAAAAPARSQGRGLVVVSTILALVAAVAGAAAGIFLP